MLAALKDGLDRCLQEPDAHSTATRAERQDGGNARSVGLACPGGLWTQRSARAGQGRGDLPPGPLTSTAGRLAGGQGSSGDQTHNTSKESPGMLC